MNRYPEWFLGGPWHGEDKRLRAPNLDRAVHVAVHPELSMRDLLDMSPEMNATYIEQVRYEPQRCVIFGIRLTVWVLSSEIQNLHDLNSPISKALGELVMLPHRDPETRHNLQGHTDLYRQRWDMERQIRTEMEATYRQRLMDASIASRPEFRPEPTPRYKLGEDVTNGVYVEVVYDGRMDVIAFDQITTYFDQGNDEMSPAWVATAQGPSEHSETKPYIGYGTSEKAAIIALAADRLGVYARMVDLEKETAE